MPKREMRDVQCGKPRVTGNPAVSVVLPTLAAPPCSSTARAPPTTPSLSEVQSAVISPSRNG